MSLEGVWARAKVERELSAMGADADAVAAYLVVAEAQGRPGDPASCPVALRLGSVLGQAATVSVTESKVLVHLGDDLFSVVTPAPVGAFVVGYDDDAYPELDTGADDEWVEGCDDAFDDEWDDTDVGESHDQEADPDGELTAARGGLR